MKDLPPRRDMKTTPHGRCGKKIALHRIVRAAIFFFAVAPSWAQSPNIATQGGVSSLRIEVMERVTVPRAAVRFGHLIAPNDRLPSQWMEQVVAMLPPGDGTITLHQSELRRAMQAWIPTGLVIEWCGAPTITIARGQSFAQVPRRQYPDIQQTSATEVARVERPAAIPAANPAIPGTVPVSVSPPPNPPAESIATPIAASAANVPEVAPSTQANTKKPNKEVEEIPLRIRKLIQQAVDRAIRDEQGAYTAEIDWSSASLSLARANRIVAAIPTAPLAPGELAFQLDADTPGGHGHFPLRVRLTSTTAYLVAAKPLRIGHIVTRDDIEIRPLADAKGSQLIEHPESVMGKQVRRYLAAGTWLTPDVISDPVVIRKQDLVEVRVEGGGVVVRTTARALDEGAIGELLQVETLEPKSKLMTRVVSSGVVEILTRPPQVPTPSDP